MFNCSVTIFVLCCLQTLTVVGQYIYNVLCKLIYDCFTPRLVPWEKSVGEQIGNAWQRLPDMWPSGVSFFTSSAGNMSHRVRKMSGRIHFPVFQKLCANLGKDAKVKELTESNQGGNYINA